jgi:Uncharacterised nucleotidyltransferase
VLLARAQPSEKAREETLRLLASDIHWPLFLERAYAHQLVPLLYQNLSALGFPHVPDTVQGELKHVFTGNALRNILLAKELARLLRLLGNAQIPVIPLKGVMLAESLYGDLALRVCADQDILVPKENVIDAFRILTSSGYTSHLAASSLLRLLPRYGKDCELFRQEEAHTYPLELHCGLVWGGPLESALQEQIWAEATRTTFLGADAFALSAEWEFLYFAVHAARHGWISLKWFTDLDRICRRGMVDWQSVGRKANSLGWEDAVRSSLSVCARWFETPIDPSFAPTNLLSGPRFRRPADLQVPSEILFSLRLLKRPAQKLQFMAIRLFIPTLLDYEFVQLPTALFFLYYILHPVRVSIKTIGWIFQAAFQRLRRKITDAGEELLCYAGDLHQLRSRSQRVPGDHVGGRNSGSSK